MEFQKPKEGTFFWHARGKHVHETAVYVSLQVGPTGRHTSRRGGWGRRIEHETLSLSAVSSSPAIIISSSDPPPYRPYRQPPLPLPPKQEIPPWIPTR